MTTAKYNIANVQLLRDWVNKNHEHVSIHMDMETFMDLEDGDSIQLDDYLDAEPDCGSNMCLIGFAGSCGITELKPLRSDKLWADYSERVFFEGGRSPSYSEEWEFLFATHWPNSVQSALDRMDYVITHGRVPPKDEWCDFGWEW